MEKASLFDFLHHLDELQKWESSFGDFSHFSFPQQRSTQAILSEVADRLQGNYPFHHPAYAGQMLKSPHSIALWAYWMATTINPNNHALDGGPPSSQMEKELIHDFIRLFDFPVNSLGHLTSSGTIANLEALWIAREIHPNKGIAISKTAHYTHQRMCQVLGMDCHFLPENEHGDPHLSTQFLEQNNIGTLVLTAGTTGTGAVESINEAIVICKNLGLRLHVDAAYGGYYCILAKSNLPFPKKTDWLAISKADSVVIDPHKHGLQPYGCGCVLFRDAGVGSFYKHDSPYTYFSSDEHHLGEISLECSRSGASAVALWATLQAFPLNEQAMGAILKTTRQAAVTFAKEIDQNPDFVRLNKPDTDIVIYCPQGKSSSEISERSKALFTKGAQAKPEQQLHLSLYSLPSKRLSSCIPDLDLNLSQTTVLRSVFMKPEHLDFIPEMLNRLRHILDEITSK